MALAACATSDVTDGGGTDTPTGDGGTDSTVRNDSGDVHTPTDTRSDVPVGMDVAHDVVMDIPVNDTTTPPDTSVMDTGPIDTGVVDTGVVDTGPPDTGPITCAAAGGTCVPLVPSACPPPNMVGGGYSCGGGLGVECCLPGDAGTPVDTGVTDASSGMMPVCMHAGTANEGWYTSSGTLLCLVSCAGQVVRCQRIGTTAQGWYAASGHGCPPYSQLVVHDSTCI
jgi:hypothetical protein